MDLLRAKVQPLSSYRGHRTPKYLRTALWFQAQSRKMVLREASLRLTQKHKAGCFVKLCRKRHCHRIRYPFSKVEFLNRSAESFNFNFFVSPRNWNPARRFNRASIYQGGFRRKTGIKQKLQNEAIVCWVIKGCYWTYGGVCRVSWFVSHSPVLISTS